jgi:hypothetical protein
MKYEWMVTAEKCGDAWKVGIQTENGDVYFSKKSYTTKQDAFIVAQQIYKKEEFFPSQFEFDYINKGNQL